MKKFLIDRGWKARRQPGSGNLPYANMKNDVWGEHPNGVSVSIDHKSTRGEKTISLHRNDLEKCYRDAEANDDFGVLTFGFKGKHNIYAVIELEELLWLLSETPAILDRLNSKSTGKKSKSET